MKVYYSSVPFTIVQMHLTIFSKFCEKLGAEAQYLSVGDMLSGPIAIDEMQIIQFAKNETSQLNPLDFPAKHEPVFPTQKSECQTILVAFRKDQSSIGID